MLMHPASPIINLTKKFRSRHSSGPSLEGLQALSGLDGSGEFTMTPVGSEGGAPRVGHGDGDGDGDGDEDGEASFAGSDGGSELSGESIEEGGGGGAAAAAAAAGKPKRASKLAMVRGMSQGLRRKKKQQPPVGATEAMTIGRASLMGGRGGDNSYLRAHDADGEGARSYTGGWSKRPSSPEHGSRYALVYDR